MLVQSPALPVTSYVAFGQLFKLLKPQLSRFPMPLMTCTHRVFERISCGRAQFPVLWFEEVVISLIIWEYPGPNLNMVYFTSVINKLRTIISLSSQDLRSSNATLPSAKNAEEKETYHQGSMFTQSYLSGVTSFFPAKTMTFHQASGHSLPPPFITLYVFLSPLKRQAENPA